MASEDLDQFRSTFHIEQCRTAEMNQSAPDFRSDIRFWSDRIPFRSIMPYSRMETQTDADHDHEDDDHDEAAAAGNRTRTLH